MFPRFEELVPAETTDFRMAPSDERLGFGIAGLDRLLDRGVSPGDGTGRIIQPGDMVQGQRPAGGRGTIRLAETTPSH